MNKELLINFLKNNASISFDPQDEDIPVRGNAVASDDPAYDKQVEDGIIDRLNQGDLSVWFCAKVTAECFGFRESTYLGGCSYDSFAQFQAGGYYQQMVTDALELLADTIIRKFGVFKTLEELIGK